MRSGTLDQKPEDVNGPDEAKPDWSGDAPPSGGGFLGRWRAGVTPQGTTYENEKPLWRRMLVGFLLWTSILGFGFIALSLLAVFAIGWTGPPPTFNMAGTAMKGAGRLAGTPPPPLTSHFPLWILQGLATPW